MLGNLITDSEKYGINAEMQRYLRDVQDHALLVTEQVQAFRELLSNILSVNHTLVGIDQNDEVKRISAWAAIIFAPTLISGIYGMNFDNMPELQWHFGYPYALALMLLVCTALYLIFKHRCWL